MRLLSLNRLQKLSAKPQAVNVTRVLQQRRLQTFKLLCFIGLVNFFVEIALPLAIPNQAFVIPYTSFAQESKDYEKCMRFGGVDVDCYCQVRYQKPSIKAIEPTANDSPYEWKCESASPKYEVRWIDFYEACKNVYGINYNAKLKRSAGSQDWKCEKK